MNRITCPKTSLSYRANTFITSKERKPLYNEQNNLSQKLRYSEVPLYYINYFADETTKYIIIGVCAGVGGLLLLGICCMLLCCCCCFTRSPKRDTSKSKGPLSKHHCGRRVCY